MVNGDPLVIDFGIAHLVNATRLTQTGMFVGTPGYLAPEIIRDSEITQAADVHALASRCSSVRRASRRSARAVRGRLLQHHGGPGQHRPGAPPGCAAGSARHCAVEARRPAERPVACCRMARPSTRTVTSSTRRRPTAAPRAARGCGNADGTRVLDGATPDATHVLHGAASETDTCRRPSAPAGDGGQLLRPAAAGAVRRAGAARAQTAVRRADRGARSAGSSPAAGPVHHRVRAASGLHARPPSPAAYVPARALGPGGVQHPAAAVRRPAGRRIPGPAADRPGQADAPPTQSQPRPHTPARRPRTPPAGPPALPRGPPGAAGLLLTIAGRAGAACCRSW